MKTHFPGLIIILVTLGLMAAGCGTMKAPLKSDRMYPSDWPDISSLGTECKDLNGTWIDEGTVVDEKGNLTPVLLSSLFFGNVSTKSGILSLNVITKKLDSNQDSIASLEMVMGTDNKHAPLESHAGNPFIRKELEPCYCIQGTFLAISDVPLEGPNILGWAYLFRVGFAGGQMNVWFTKATDGSLIVKVDEHIAGMILIVPFHTQSSTWARFTRVGD
jgi:hypothetical protein